MNDDKFLVQDAIKILLNEKNKINVTLLRSLNPVAPLVLGMLRLSEADKPGISFGEAQHNKIPIR
jgi:hypothetical protein